MNRLIIKANGKELLAETSEKREIIVCEAIKGILEYSPELFNKLTIEIINE